jgi:hypothetical protein
MAEAGLHSLLLERKETLILKERPGWGGASLSCPRLQNTNLSCLFSGHRSAAASWGTRRALGGHLGDGGPHSG